MAYFKGNVVPPTYKRITKFINENPQYNKWSEGDQFFDILEQSADLMDDGVANDSTPYRAPTVLITGISASIDVSAYDIGTGNVTSGQVTAEVVPSNTTESYTIVYSSSDEAVATVDASGVVTAVTEGSATITAAISGTSFSQDLPITVANTV